MQNLAPSVTIPTKTKVSLQVMTSDQVCTHSLCPSEEQNFVVANESTKAKVLANKICFACNAQYFFAQPRFQVHQLDVDQS